MSSLFKKWWKNPLQIGSISSSSQNLVQLMLSQVPEDAKVIVEFGAGTGPITEALAQKFSKAQIFAFELDPEMAALAQKKAPSVHMHAADVSSASQKLPPEVVGKVDVILSSLPFLTLPEGLDQKIIQSAFEILKPNGSFVQYTYLPVLPPIPIYAELGLWAQFVGAEFRNLPPAFVWSFRRERRKKKR